MPKGIYNHKQTRQGLSLDKKKYMQDWYKEHPDYQKKVYQKNKENYLKRNTFRRKSKNEIELNNTASYKGYKSELEALKYLKGAKLLKTKAGDPKHHWDINWQDWKVNVKSAWVIYNNKWTFRLKEKMRSDYYLCMCYTNNELQKVFLIPEADVPKAVISIPRDGNSKYNIFEI